MTKKHEEEHEEATKEAPKTEPVGKQPDPHLGLQGRAPREGAPDDAEMERMRREDPLFIEHTRPEDPSGRPGQLTRDNVNPNIPSGKPGDPPGPIVDPNTLGMPQGGIAPTNPMRPERSPDQPPKDPRGKQ